MEDDKQRIDAARARRRASRKSLARLLHKKVVRDLVLDEGLRMDGRDLDTIRPDLGRGRPAAAGPRLCVSSRAARPRR